MTKTETAAKHTIMLEERCRMTLTGVKEVTAFSDSSVVLVTTAGGLTIGGKGLSISRLNTDTGELFVSGEVSLMKYAAPRRRGGLLEGLLK